MLFQEHYLEDGQWIVRWQPQAEVWACIEPLATSSTGLGDHVAYMAQTQISTLYRVLIRSPKPMNDPPPDLRRLQWKDQLYEILHPWSFTKGPNYLQTVVKQLQKEYKV